MNFLSGAYWDIGLRPRNDDSILLEIAKTSRGNLLLGGVADGIGGLMEGQIASGYLMERLNQKLFADIIPLHVKRRGLNIIKRSILREFYEVNEELRRYGNRKNVQLGTTISLILIMGNKYIIFHLGDSKIFMFKHNKTYEITQNHSKRKGTINKCVGSFSFMKPDIITGRLSKNTGILIASDGFYERIKFETEFWNPNNIALEEQIEKRLHEMGRLIKLKGQTDNASAIYIKCI